MVVLHTQAESGACSQAPLLLTIKITASIYTVNHQMGQSRVYRVTRLRTDGVHRRESARTGPAVIVLMVAQKTGAPIQETPWTNFCAPLWSHIHYTILYYTFIGTVVDMCDMRYRETVSEAIVQGDAALRHSVQQPLGAPALPSPSGPFAASPWPRRL